MKNMIGKLIDLTKERDDENGLISAVFKSIEGDDNYLKLKVKGDIKHEFLYENYDFDECDRFWSEVLNYTRDVYEDEYQNYFPSNAIAFKIFDKICFLIPGAELEIDFINKKIYGEHIEYVDCIELENKVVTSSKLFDLIPNEYDEENLYEKVGSNKDIKFDNEIGIKVRVECDKINECIKQPIIGFESLFNEFKFMMTKDEDGFLYYTLNNGDFEDKKYKEFNINGFDFSKKFLYKGTYYIGNNIDENSNVFKKYILDSLKNIVMKNRENEYLLYNLNDAINKNSDINLNNILDTVDSSLSELLDYKTYSLFGDIELQVFEYKLSDIEKIGYEDKGDYLLLNNPITQYVENKNSVFYNSNDSKLIKSLRGKNTYFIERIYKENIKDDKVFVEILIKNNTDNNEDYGFYY